MKISIITVCFNSAKTIKDTIESVLSQTYKNIEYIIIDGASTDETIEIVKSYGDKIDKFISESDNGLYDAMNKGIHLATGDIVGILNSDDFYINEFVLEKIVKEFRDKKVDSVYADLIYVKSNNLNKSVRYYSSMYFNIQNAKYGICPAHPTFFVKKPIYDKFGLFKTSYKIAADVEIMTRFLCRCKISYSYLPEPLIKMRIGGESTSLKGFLYINSLEKIRACRENGIKTNFIKILFRYYYKILENFRNAKHPNNW